MATGYFAFDALNNRVFPIFSGSYIRYITYVWYLYYILDIRIIVLAKLLYIASNNSYSAYKFPMKVLDFDKTRSWRVFLLYVQRNTRYKMSIEHI